MKRRWLIGLGWSTLGAFFAAGFLVPYKVAAQAAGPRGLVLPMFLIAAAVNTVLDGLLPRRSGASAAPRWDKTTLGVAAALGVASAVGNEAVSRALISVSPGLASVTLRTQVIFVAVGGLLLLRETLGPRFWFGVVLALGGYALIHFGTSAGVTVSLAGVAWAVLASASFATMQLAVRGYIERIDPVRVNSLRLWLAAGLVALLPGRVGNLGSLGGKTWGLAALAALSGPVLSRLSLMRSLRFLPAAHATLALFLGPVFAYLLGGMVLGEWPSGVEIGGSLVILIAVALPVTEMARSDVALE